jgi:hypothetical protein
MVTRRGGVLDELEAEMDEKMETCEVDQHIRKLTGASEILLQEELDRLSALLAHLSAQDKPLVNVFYHVQRMVGMHAEMHMFLRGFSMLFHLKKYLDLASLPCTTPALLEIQDMIRESLQEYVRDKMNEVVSEFYSFE